MTLRVIPRWAALAVLTVAVFATGSTSVSAATVPQPHTAVGGFPSATGAAYSLVYADGSVRPTALRDAFSLRLDTPITGAAPLPTDDGYWEVASDGNVFSFGAAPALGGLGGIALNQPVFAMAATKTGKGYWLAARDGGVFAFGDAPFRGSAGALHLTQPIVGLATDPTGKGYRLVARDGGIFTFGKIPFAGSLPGRHRRVRDVIGMATTPTGKGYWIARRDGEVYPFGDADRLGNGGTSSCDPFTAIIGNPAAPGYRLVTASGRTVAFGAAPGGSAPSGTPRTCGRVTAHIELPSSTMVAGSTMAAYLVVDNETRAPLRIRDGICEAGWAIALTNGTITNSPIIGLGCRVGSLVLPVGESQSPYARTVTATYNKTPPVAGECPCPFPPGEYTAKFFGLGNFPPVIDAAVTVLPKT